MESFSVANAIKAAYLFAGVVRAAPLLPVRYSGYLVDVYCYGLSQAGAGALDGTDVIQDPSQHSVHCMRDVPQCIDGGYYFAERSNRTKTYGVRFLLDAVTNSRVAELLSNVSDRPDKPGELTVTAIGMTTGIAALGSAPILEKAVLSPCNPPGSKMCDGVCVGAACNLFSVNPLNFKPELPTSPKLWGHMICMMLSWGFLLPLGTLWARNMRESGTKLCNMPIWFQGHRIMQSIGWAVMILGFVLILLEKKKHFSSTHEKVGLAVVFVGALQPLNAQLRHLPFIGHPREDGTRSVGRLLWEMLHKSAGWLAVFFGAVNVGLGIVYARNIGFTQASNAASFLMIPLCILVVVGVAGESHRFYRCVIPTEEKEDAMEAGKTT